MAMTPKGFITRFSGDTDVAGTLSIAAPRALYAVAFGSKPKKNPPELLPPAVADCACGIRLKKSEHEKTGIINRRHGFHLSRREICPNKRSHPSDSLTGRSAHRDTVHVPRS